MDDAPSWPEIAKLLAQLAQISAGHADIARAALRLSEQPAGHEQLRQSLVLLSSGQDELAKALQHVSQIFQTLGAEAGDDQLEN